MILYMVGKLAPNPIHSIRGLDKYVPGKGYFRAVPSQNGEKNVTLQPPLLQSLNGSSINLTEVPVTGATFAGHHGPINVRLSFPNCCLVFFFRYAPCEWTFVTALLDQHTVVEMSKIVWLHAVQCIFY